jgi:hypothetical protein
MGLQTLENKVLSRGIIGKSAPILAEITIRKSQLVASTSEKVWQTSCFIQPEAVFPSKDSA